MKWEKKTYRKHFGWSARSIKKWSLMHCPLRIFADIPLSSAYWLMCVWFLNDFFCVSLFSALLLLVQFSISFYLHVFILVLACFWYSMLRSHQVNFVFCSSLGFSTSKIEANKQRSYKSTRKCVWAKSSFVVLRVYLIIRWFDGRFFSCCILLVS